jgi:hypothetical protein
MKPLRTNINYIWAEGLHRYIHILLPSPVDSTINTVPERIIPKHIWEPTNKSEPPSAISIMDHKV